MKKIQLADSRYEIIVIWTHKWGDAPNTQCTYLVQEEEEEDLTLGGGFHEVQSVPLPFVFLP